MFMSRLEREGSPNSLLEQEIHSEARTIRGLLIAACVGIWLISGAMFGLGALVHWGLSWMVQQPAKAFSTVATACFALQFAMTVAFIVHKRAFMAFLVSMSSLLPVLFVNPLF